MASSDGSRVVHDRYPEPRSYTVGLPSRGSGCRDDACILGIFDWASISLFYRSSQDGEAGIGTGATTIAGIAATTLAKASATATSPASGTTGVDSSIVDEIRPRC